MMLRTTAVVLFSLISLGLNAGTLNREDIKGRYHLGVPERGKTQVNMDFGQLGNKTVLAIACDNCPPATYSFLQEESSTLQVATFTTAGLYVFQYDNESFIIVQPDGQLGRKIWSKIGHANIYSKNPSKAKSVSRNTIEEFAINLSKKIMNQEVGKMEHSGGTYHLAVPINHMGKAQTTYEISFKTEPKKQIDIKPCDRCGSNEYKHLPEESAIAGVDVYRYASSDYIFDLKDGVLVHTFSNAGGLGRTLWGKNSHYNVFSNNQAYIRQLLTSKEKQNILDQMMSEYFKSIKETLEARAKEAQAEKVATRELPKAGLSDASQSKQALDAANRWAEAWKWKETIQRVYFTSNDWALTRNRLTGITTGKVITGIATMKHPDGRCRFQYVTFRQDFDGNNYSNFHMTGIGPIYDINCDNMQ